MLIKGKLVDDETRCVHYHSHKDIIAIRFKCCGDYYPCFECHAEATEHAAQRWGKHELDVKAILCGQCQTELSIAGYLSANHQCPNCKAAFNPRCALHYHLYWEQ